MLCVKCSHIHFQPLGQCEPIVQEPQRLEDAHIAYFERYLFYFHHKDKDALRLSSEQGCHLCTMLWQELFGHDSTSGTGFPFAPTEVVFHPRRGNWSLFEDWRLNEDFLVSCEDRRAYCRSLSNQDSRAGSKVLGPIVEMLKALTTYKDSINFNSPNTPSFSIPKNAYSTLSTHMSMPTPEYQPKLDSILCSPWADTSTISQANMALASVWLHACRQNHTPCSHAQGGSILPHRIIDIGDPHRPFLDIGRCRREHYVTLSYKWGNCQRYVTTTQNLSEHRISIPLAELPRTFKDAIHVANALGFRWLWIDALCILQDSDEDQACEISFMDQVFQLSTLTIFAAHGDNADAGISFSRDPRWTKPCWTSWKFTSDGRTFERADYLSITSDHHTDPVQPLFKRGWVLQEEVLATRGLYFTTREMAWRCLSEYCTESFPSFKLDATPDAPDLSPWDTLGELRRWIHSKYAITHQDQWNRRNHFDCWYDVIKIYTRRSLTYPSDVLSGLSGLANAIEETHGCAYLAGLWEEDLQIGLTWFVSGRGFSADKLPENSFDLAIPSWFWASRYGQPIDYHAWPRNTGRIRCEGIILSKHNAVYVDSGSRGKLQRKDTRRTLSLTGQCRAARVRQGLVPDHRLVTKMDSYGRWDLWMSEVEDLKTGSKIGHIWLDDDPKTVHLDIVYCLLCLVGRKDELYLTCLALVPTDSSNEEFTRVGLVIIEKTDWFGSIGYYTCSGQTDTEFLRTVNIS